MTASLRFLLVVVAALAVALGTGCGSDEPAGTTIAADVDAVRTAAARAMGEVDTVRFTIERSGAVVHIDEGGALAFERASGRFAAPSSADALVTVTAGGAAIEIGAVAIDGTTWITNPVSGRWEEAPAGLGFDPATLFDPDLGWRPLLATGLRDARLVEPEPDADGRYHLRGVADAERIAVLTGGLVDESVPIDVWVEATTGRVLEARFETGEPDGVTAWRLALSDYGEPVDVEAPDVGGS